MLHMGTTIRKRVSIPATCRERYLPLQGAGAQELTARGIQFAGVSALRAGYVIGNPEPSGLHMAIGTTGGRGFFRTASFACELRAGSLLVMPGDRACEFGVIGDDWRILWTYLSDLPRWTGVKRDIVHRRGVEFGMLAAAMDGYLRERERLENDPTRERPAELQAELCGRYWDDLLEAKPVGGRNLEHLWTEVRKDVGGAWSLPRMAGIAGMSGSSLQRLCRRLHGVTPWKMVIGWRMAEAKLMLERSGYPLKVIAERVGYGDEFAFSAAFKGNTGRSPSQYRQQHGAVCGDSALGGATE